MKVIYTLGFLLFFISGCFAQNYIPILSENHIWNIDFNGSTAPPITVSGTTITNGKDYKSVFYGTNETTCLLREENGIIYKYDTGTNEEYIYYDFSLQVGDTYNCIYFFKIA